MTVTTAQSDLWATSSTSAKPGFDGYRALSHDWFIV